LSLTEIEAVYRNRGGDFFRFALAQTGDPEAARDAVQDGFARAIRSRWSYRGSGSREAWLARCVINAAHDATRDAKAATPLGSEERERGERVSLDVVPSSVIPSGPPWRLGVSKPPSPKEDPNEAAR
jgi:DNA-directed RNA polymerase specialized sigma24 family protein